MSFKAIGENKILAKISEFTVQESIMSVRVFRRITVWHHEACRVMTNGDSKGQIFISHPQMNNGFFFLLTIITIFYVLKKNSQELLNTMRFDLT